MTRNYSIELSCYCCASHILQLHTYNMLHKEKPGLFAVSLRLLNLHLRAWGTPDRKLYRISPLHDSYEMKLPCSFICLICNNRKTIGALVDVDVTAMVGVMKFLIAEGCDT